jgi:hypothetical protein
MMKNIKAASLKPEENPSQLKIPTEAMASVKQFRGMVRERNKLYAACCDILEYLNKVEDSLLQENQEPQWDVDYVRNTLENAINNEEI